MIKLNTQNHVDIDIERNVKDSVWDNLALNAPDNLLTYVENYLIHNLLDNYRYFLKFNTWKELQNHTKLK